MATDKTNPRRLCLGMLIGLLAEAFLLSPVAVFFYFDPDNIDFNPNNYGSIRGLISELIWSAAWICHVEVLLVAAFALGGIVWIRLHRTGRRSWPYSASLGFGSNFICTFSFFFAAVYLKGGVPDITALAVLVVSSASLGLIGAVVCRLACRLNAVAFCTIIIARAFIKLSRECKNNSNSGGIASRPRAPRYDVERGSMAIDPKELAKQKFAEIIRNVKNRDEQATQIIWAATTINGGMGLVPFGINLWTFIGVSTVMIVWVGNIYGHTLNNEKAGELIRRIFSSVGAMFFVGTLGLKAFAEVLKLFGVVTAGGSAVAGMALDAVVMGAITYALGHTAKKVLAKGSFEEDLNNSNIKETFMNAFEEGKSKVRASKR